MNVRPGNWYRVLTRENEFVGLSMPDSDAKVLRLKLESGYNVGVLRSHIVRITAVRKKVSVVKKVSSTPTQKKSLPLISILHTGGTIASKVDYTTGGVTAQFSDSDLLEMFPQLKDLARISSRLLSNMFSEDIRFSHMNIIAQAVFKELTKKEVQGVIITHGTDTLAFTAAALSFLLEGLAKPVVLVGAQRSSDRGSSDARLNLLCAAQFILHAPSCGEVVVCMHESSEDTTCALHRGVKVKKMHTSRRDAFVSINDSCLATITLDGQLHWVKEPRTHSAPSRVVQLKENLNIGVLVARPNMFAKELLAYRSCDGLLLVGSGLGHFPLNQFDARTKENGKIFQALVRLSKKMPVVMVSNCISGRLNLQVYGTGRKLLAAGVLGHLLDLHFDVAYMKLAYLLSCQKKHLRTLYAQDLRGEICPRSTYTP